MVYTTKTNLKIAYFLAFCGELFFPIAVWLFFYTRFLNFKQIVLMTAVSSLLGLCLQVPTGALADFIGRKTTIVISYFLWVITMIATAYARTFTVFMLIAAGNALVNALYYGSFEALVYDSLKENHEENQYSYVASRIEAITWVGLFVGSIFGGFMFEIWFRLPFVAQSIIALTAAIMSLKLVEPKKESKKYQFKSFIAQNIQGFKELFQSFKISRLSLIFIVIGAGYNIASSILGISQGREYGLSPEIVGIIFAIGYLFSATASHFYPKLKNIFGVKKLFIFSTAILLLSFLLAKFVGVFIGVILIIGRLASSTTYNNTKSITLNNVISSDNRATTLSTVGLLVSLPYAIFGYFIGDFIDKNSPNSFAFLLGIILIILLLLINFPLFFCKKTIC